MAYSFDCLIETEGFLKVGGIQVHIHCKSGNISETVQNRETLLSQTTNRKWYMMYRIVAIPMTVSVLQSHSPTASLYKCNFLYSCAAVDKILND